MPAEPRMAATFAAVEAALHRAALAYRAEVIVRQEGRVVGVADRVLRVRGLGGAALEELIEIGQTGLALVLGLEEDELQAVALDDVQTVVDGARARTLGRVVSIGVGEPLLGRVIDPLGRPLDGVPLPERLLRQPLERSAPPIHARAAVHAPLPTGLLTVDAMLPIGRGQRELVLGDEGTGKTALALDVMLRQRNTDIVCVYVAIGRRRSESWQVAETLRQGGGRWVIVAAPDDESPGLRTLAPYAGATIAEYFAERGGHALVVYDDLTSHAVAWRELSLLLRRPPGREAYPGDVFFLHSRLLERAAQLSVERGGGSVSALPLAALEGGRLTAYVPTNLVSITDGQIVLSQGLFSAGQKPAIDVGLSVSRVGSRAQPQALSELSAHMRLEYASFLEVEAFAQLGTRLESATQARIDHGRRVRFLLRARRLEPLGLFDEVVLLALAGARQSLLRVPEPALGEVARDLCRAARAAFPLLAESVERDAMLSGEDRHRIEELLQRRIIAAFPGRADA